MIDRALVVGTFPDEGTCLLVGALLIGAAVLLALAGAVSWLRRDE